MLIFIFTALYCNFVLRPEILGQDFEKCTNSVHHGKVVSDDSNSINVTKAQ